MHFHFLSFARFFRRVIVVGWVLGVLYVFDDYCLGTCIVASSGPWPACLFISPTCPLLPAVRPLASRPLMRPSRSYVLSSRSAAYIQNIRKFYRNRSEGWGDTKIAVGLPATSGTPRRAGPSWGGGCRGRSVEGQPQSLRPSRLLSVFPFSLFSPHDLHLPSSDPLLLPPRSEPLWLFNGFIF